MSGLIVAKVTAIFALACFVLLPMQRASAAQRHTVIVAALLAGLFLPALNPLTPAWEILPRPQLMLIDEALLSEPAAGAVLQTVPAAPVAAVDERAGIDLSAWLPGTWLTGTAVLLLLLAMRLLAMHQAVRSASVLDDPQWNALLTQMCKTIGVGQPVTLKLRHNNGMPAAWGVGRPVVLLPAGCQNWSVARRRSVLAHELAHVARHDASVFVLANIACALHWFNPFAWLLKHRLVIESEHACDDVAIDFGGSAPGYADHLLSTALAYRKHRSLAPVMAARSQLEGRIMAILDTNRNRTQASARTQFLIAAAVAVMLVPLSSLAWAHAGVWAGTLQHVQGHWQSDSSDFSAHLKKLGIDKGDVDALIDGLSSRDPVTRGASAWALGEANDPRVIDPLIQAGYDGDARVRQWAIRSLSAWDAPHIAPMLVDRLQDSDAEVRQWAVRTLERHDDQVRVQPLLSALGDSDIDVREWAVRVLAGADDERVQPALATRLSLETDRDVAEWLVRSLDSTGLRQSVDALLAALGSDSAEVRQWAVRSLSAVQDDQVTDAIIGMLRDSDAEVREWGARALAVCGNRRAVAPLQSLRDDPSRDVRAWVRRALEEIDC